MNGFIHKIYMEIRPRKVVYFILANLIALSLMSVSFYTMTFKYGIDSKFLLFGTSIALGSIPMILIFYYKFSVPRTKSFLFTMLSPYGRSGIGKTTLVESLTSNVLYSDLIIAWKLALQGGDRNSATKIIAAIDGLGHIAMEKGLCEVAERAALSLEVIRKDVAEEELVEMEDPGKYGDLMREPEMKPWELMFHIIHVIGNRQPIPTEGVIQYFERRFPDLKGTSIPNIYRNLQRLRMKGYIEYGKILYKDQSSYILSEKGKNIFKMTKADAARKLRTVEEWDHALMSVFQRIDRERKQDEEALFYVLDSIFPDLDDRQLIWILYTKGNIYELKGNFDKAKEEYLRMEGICEKVDDSKGRAYALKGLGNVAFNLERFSVAEQLYTKCREIAKSLQDNLLLSDALNNIGACLYMLDNLGEALQFFEKSLELSRNDPSRMASTLYNEGLCYIRRGDFNKAQELWIRSLNIYERLQERIEIEKVQHNLREIDRQHKRDFLENEYRRAKQIGTLEDIKKAYKELVWFEMNNFRDRDIFTSIDRMKLKDPIVR